MLGPELSDLLEMNSPSPETNIPQSKDLSEGYPSDCILDWQLLAM